MDIHDIFQAPFRWWPLSSLLHTQVILAEAVLAFLSNHDREGRSAAS